MRVYKVDCQWDGEAKVWYVQNSDVPGLSAEAATVDEMVEILHIRIPELLNLNTPGLQRDEVPFELLCGRREKLRLSC